MYDYNLINTLPEPIMHCLFEQYIKTTKHGNYSESIKYLIDILTVNSAPQILITTMTKYIGECIYEPESYSNIYGNHPATILKYFDPAFNNKKIVDNLIKIKKESPTNYLLELISHCESVHNMKFEDLMIFYSGYSNIEGGHAITFICSKISNSKYRVALCNSGNGLEYHTVRNSNLAECIVVNDYDKSMVKSLYVMTILMRSFVSSNVKEFYDILKNIEFRLYPNLYSNLEFPQLSGSCTYYSVYYAIKYYYVSSNLDFNTLNSQIIKYSRNKLQEFVKKDAEIPSILESLVKIHNFAHETKIKIQSPTQIFRNAPNLNLNVDYHVNNYILMQHDYYKLIDSNNLNDILNYGYTFATANNQSCFDSLYFNQIFLNKLIEFYTNGNFIPITETILHNMCVILAYYYDLPTTTFYHTDVQYIFLLIILRTNPDVFSEIATEHSSDDNYKITFLQTLMITQSNYFYTESDINLLIKYRKLFTNSYNLSHEDIYFSIYTNDISCLLTNFNENDTLSCYYLTYLLFITKEANCGKHDKKNSFYKYQHFYSAAKITRSNKFNPKQLFQINQKGGYHFVQHNWSQNTNKNRAESYDFETRSHVINNDAIVEIFKIINNENQSILDVNNFYCPKEYNVINLNLNTTDNKVYFNINDKNVYSFGNLFSGAIGLYRILENIEFINKRIIKIYFAILLTYNPQFIEEHKQKIMESLSKLISLNDDVINLLITILKNDIIDVIEEHLNDKEQNLYKLYFNLYCRHSYMNKNIIAIIEKNVNNNYYQKNIQRIYNESFQVVSPGKISTIKIGNNIEQIYYYEFQGEDIFKDSIFIKKNKAIIRTSFKKLRTKMFIIEDQLTLLYNNVTYKRINFEYSEKNTMISQLLLLKNQLVTFYSEPNNYVFYLRNTFINDQEIFFTFDKTLKLIICDDKNETVYDVISNPNKMIYFAIKDIPYCFTLFNNKTQTNKILLIESLSIISDCQEIINTSIFCKASNKIKEGMLKPNEFSTAHIVSINLPLHSLNLHEEALKLYALYCIIYYKCESIKYLAPKLINLASSYIDELIKIFFKEGLNTPHYAYYQYLYSPKDKHVELLKKVETYHIAYDQIIYSHRFTSEYFTKPKIDDPKYNFFQNDYVITKKKNIHINKKLSLNIQTSLATFSKKYYICNGIKPYVSDLSAVKDYINRIENITFQICNNIYNYLFQSSINMCDAIITFRNELYYIMFTNKIKALLLKYLDANKDVSCFDFMKEFSAINSKLIYLNRIRKTEIILFELSFGNYIRNDQYITYNSITNKIDHALDNNTEYDIHQMLMGAGKTSVILPLIIIKFINIRNLNYLFIVLPENLIRQTHNNLIDNYSHIIGDCKITILLTTQQLKNILDNNYNKQIIITTSFVLQAFKIELISYDELSVAKNYLEMVRENSLFIFDEFDSLYNPLSSELNIKLEQKSIWEVLPKEELMEIIENTLQNKIDNQIEELKYNKDYGFGLQHTHNNLFVAVPYATINTPIKDSYFSDLKLSIILTILAYKQTKLRKVDVIRIMKEKKKIYGDINFYEDFKIKLENTIFDNVYIKYANLIEKISDENILFDKIYAEVQDTLTVDDYNQYIRENIMYILQDYIKVGTKQINSSFLDIMNCNFAKYKVAFSGTVNLSLPKYENTQYEFTNIITNEQSMGSIYAAILNGKNNYVGNNIENIIKCIGRNTYDCFIDIGAILKDYSDIEILNHFIKAFNEKEFDKDNYIYIDDQNNKKVYNFKTTKFSLYDESNDYGKYFIYYDNKHIIGIDIKQPFNFKGLASLDLNIRFTILAQGIFRLRNLNYGHTVDFIVTTKLKNDMVELNRENILNYFMKKEEEYSNNMDTKLLLQNIKMLYRENLLENKKIVNDNLYEEYDDLYENNDSDDNYDNYNYDSYENKEPFNPYKEDNYISTQVSNNFNDYIDHIFKNQNRTEIVQNLINRLLITKQTINASTIVEQNVENEVDIKTERYHYINDNKKLVPPTNMKTTVLLHNNIEYHVHKTLKDNLFIASNFSINKILHRSSIYSENKKNIMRFNAINIDYIKLNDRYVVFNTFNALNDGDIYTKHDNKHNDEELYIKYLLGKKLNLSESKRVLSYIFSNNIPANDVYDLLSLFASYVYYSNEFNGSKLCSYENNFVNNILDKKIVTVNEYNKLLSMVDNDILFDLFGLDVHSTESIKDKLIELASISSN
jgi:hypothetical protein